MNGDKTYGHRDWKPVTALFLGAVLVAVLSIALWETLSGDEARAATLIRDEAVPRKQVLEEQQKTNKELQKISGKLDALIALFKNGEAQVVPVRPKKSRSTSGRSRTDETRR